MSYPAPWFGTYVWQVRRCPRGRQSSTAQEGVCMQEDVASHWYWAGEHLSTKQLWVHGAIRIDGVEGTRCLSPRLLRVCWRAVWESQSSTMASAAWSTTLERKCLSIRITMAVCHDLLDMQTLLEHKTGCSWRVPAGNSCTSRHSSLRLLRVPLNDRTRMSNRCWARC